MGKSLAIIGRGHSVTKCNKNFVDNHDEVAIINYVIFNNYNHLISNRADHLFTNKTGLRYSEIDIQQLNLKNMYFTWHSYQRFERTNPKVKTIYPKPNLHEKILADYGFKPSSGMQCLYYFLNNCNYSEISLIGFDFYEVGSIPYYFKPSECLSEQRYLWEGDYKGNKINTPSGHDTDKSIKFLEKMVKLYSNITFNIISHNKKVNSLSYNNLNIIF